MRSIARARAWWHFLLEERPRLAVAFLFSLLIVSAWSHALVLGQAVPAPPAPQAFPWEAMAVNWINGLQVVLIPALAAGVKKWLVSIEVRAPRFVILSGVVSLGVVAETLNSYLGAGGFSLLRGALMGLVAVALREVVDTAREHGFTGK